MSCSMCTSSDDIINGCDYVTNDVNIFRWHHEWCSETDNISDWNDHINCLCDIYWTTSLKMWTLPLMKIDLFTQRDLRCNFLYTGGPYWFVAQLVVKALYSLLRCYTALWWESFFLVQIRYISALYHVIAWHHMSMYNPIIPMFTS